MIGWFSARTDDAVWASGAFPQPWAAARPAIFDAVAAMPVGDDDWTLPDEPERGPNDIGFAPGVLDGILGGAAEDAANVAKRLDRLIRRVLARADKARIAALYDALVAQDALGVIDALLDRLRNGGAIDVERLDLLFAWLMRTAPDRNAVKIAIAVVCAARWTENRAALMTLARHDEFTLYVAVGAGMDPDPDGALRAIAEHASGWGRIHCVERFSAAPRHEVKRWLVREGYKNDIMVEYTAYAAATKGDLVGQLAQAGAEDDALTDGAADILGALALGGPAETLADYADAPAAFTLFLNRLGAPPTLDQLRSVVLVRGWLRDAVDDPAPWSTADAADATARCDALLADAGNRAAVVETLAGSDEAWGAFFTARQVADAMGIDTWEPTFALIARGGDGDWNLLFASDDSERVDRALALAESVIDLDAVATGPADEFGLGPEYAPHQNVDMVLQNLEDMPGKGWPLVAAALRSPTVRNRNLALRVLAAWGAASWPDDARPLLERALAAEPRNDVRRRIDCVLASGGPNALEALEEDD